MGRQLARAVGTAGLVLNLCAGVALGEPPVPAEPCPEAAPEKLHNPDPDHTFKRAGYSDQVACWAQPGRTPRYCGYYVGGGCACSGEPRAVHEGTWGWDYCGWLLPRKVFLCWSHGRRYQGGSGAYKTDGPLFPRDPYLPQLFHHRDAGSE